LSQFPTLAKSASPDEEPSAEASTDNASSVGEVAADVSVYSPPSAELVEPRSNVQEAEQLPADDAPADEYSSVMTDGTDEIPPPVTFITLGDMPYNLWENIALTAPYGSIAQAIQASDPPVVVHYGDLKTSGEDCTDSLLAARQAQIANLHPNRIVFTPGDNDWTDCDRDSLENRFDEVERLDFLRTLFYEGEGLEMTGK